MAQVWYPDLLQDTTAFPAHMLFTFYERGSTTTSSMTDQVHLYMPEAFGQPNTVSWDSHFKGGKEALGTVADMATKASEKWGKSNKFAKWMGQAGAAIKSYGTPATDLAEIASGFMPNPYLAQLFLGVDFRNFSYTFKFVPFSESDCTKIKDIINIFRKWSLPEGPDGGGGSPYLEYPGEVEVDYMFDGDRNPWLHKFKRSVITSIDVNYTGAGMWTMMRNGFPTETVMNVTFSEIQIIVRKDVAKDY